MSSGTISDLSAVDFSTPCKAPSERLPVQVLKMSTWSATARIGFVLVFSVLLAAASFYLRLRVLSVTTATFPYYQSSEWAPFVQAYRELSWFGHGLSIALVAVAINHWIKISPRQ